MPKLKEKGIIYKCVIIVIAVATDFSTCFSVRRAMAVAATLVETATAEAVVVVITTEAAAVVPTMITTGLTGATVGAVATGSGLHARTAVAVTLATIIVAVADVTPVTTETVAAVAATLAIPATVEITADAD